MEFVAEWREGDGIGYWIGGNRALQMGDRDLYNSRESCSPSSFPYFCIEFLEFHVQYRIWSSLLVYVCDPLVILSLFASTA